jgi:hypothetical protein
MTFYCPRSPRQPSSRKPDTQTPRISKTPCSSSVYPPNSPSSNTLAPIPIRTSTSTTSWACTPRIVPDGLILGTFPSGRSSERAPAQPRIPSCWSMSAAVKATTLSSSKRCIKTCADEWSCRICRPSFSKRARSRRALRPRRTTFSSRSPSKVRDPSYCHHLSKRTRNQPRKEQPR